MILVLLITPILIAAHKCNANVKQEFVMWNHSMSEVVNSLIKNGINILFRNKYNCCKKIDIEKFLDQEKNNDLFHCWEKTIKQLIKKWKTIHTVNL